MAVKLDKSVLHHLTAGARRVFRQKFITPGNKLLERYFVESMIGTWKKMLLIGAADSFKRGNQSFFFYSREQLYLLYRARLTPVAWLLFLQLEGQNIQTCRLSSKCHDLLQSLAATIVLQDYDQEC
jgi:hypothetical protein